MNHRFSALFARHSLLAAFIVGLLLWSIMVFLAGQEQRALAEADAVRFVHFSDVHYDAAGKDTSWRLLKDSPVLLETALKDVGQEPGVDFLLFSGDSVNTPKTENFQGFFKVLKQFNQRPVYMVLGNHDVGVKPGRSRQDTIDAFRQLGGTAMFPSANTGYYSIELKPWLRLLVLDGTTDTQVSANGFVPEPQLAWVKQELAKAQSKNQMVILASHFPLVEPFHSKSHHIIKPDADRLLALINGSPNVVAYFAGHYHSAKLMTRNGIYYVTSPALVEYPNAYRTVTLHKSGRISLEWKPVPTPNLVEKSRSRSPYAKSALGNPVSDHHLVSGQLRYSPVVSGIPHKLSQ